MKRLNLAIPKEVFRAIKERVKSEPLRFRSVTHFILIAVNKLLEEK